MMLKPLILGSLLTTLTIAALSQNCYAALTAEQRLADFNQLVTQLQRSYAPLRLKEKTVGLNFSQHVESFRGRVQAAGSDNEFYLLLSSFLAGFKDGHTHGSVPSNYQATLGFVADLVDGKVLLDKIDRAVATDQLFPFHKGDRVLAIDGVSVDDLLSQLGTQTSMGSETTSRRINTFRLSNRIAAHGVAVPSGASQVTVLPRGEKQAVTVTLQWKTQGNPLVDLDDLRTSGAEASPTNPTSAIFKGSSLSDDIRKLPIFQGGLPSQMMRDFQQMGIVDEGAPKSFFKLPDGAKLVPGLPITAAVFEAAGKKIGLLRLPTFMADPESMMTIIGRAVMIMEQNTDVLVIDQTNNPGGNIALCADITSLFADKTFRDASFQVRPSLKWQTGFDEIVAKISAALQDDPKDAKATSLKPRFQTLAEEIRADMSQRKFLSKPFSLNVETSFGTIAPNEVVTYSKPILILINELDISAGDMFPAVMKDNGRATLFGSTTSGSGGNVASYGPLANSFFSFTVTESLMVRPNGSYIENNGVKPDIAYNMTEEDFINGYRGYVKAFTVEALKLAGVNSDKIEEFKKK